jgi:Ca2+-binding EF-hand superfamily protein
VILPRTNGISLKRPLNANEEAVSLIDVQGNLSSLLEGAIEDIYYRFDTMITNSIDYFEFKEFYDTIGQTISQADFDTQIMKGYCSSPGGLTLKGFKEFMKDSVKKQGEEIVFEWLNKLGYDK